MYFTVDLRNTLDPWDWRHQPDLMLDMCRQLSSEKGVLCLDRTQVGNALLDAQLDFACPLILPAGGPGRKTNNGHPILLDAST